MIILIYLEEELYQDKVLRNASILKKVYKELDQEMLLTAIVRNSFIDNDTFQLIKAQIMDTRRREK